MPENVIARNLFITAGEAAQRWYGMDTNTRQRN